MKRSATLAIACTLLLTGCSLIPATPTPSPTPSPSDVALRAGQTMLTVQSLRFSIDISGELPFLDSYNTVALKRAVGDLLRPDSVRAVVTLRSFGIITEIGVIGLGDEQYVTNPLNQRWERLSPGQGWYFDPAVLFDPEYGIEALLRTTDWAFGTAEEAAGDLIVLVGQAPGERLWLLTSGVIHSGEYAVEMWIDPAEGYVHQISLLELESGAEEPTEWVISLSQFDTAVTIEAPPLE